jgi:MoxR-like ATPase
MSATPADTGLLERADELAAIADAIADVAGGMGRIVLLEGNSGVGKTRLAEAAAERAAVVIPAGRAATSGRARAPGSTGRRRP